MIPTGSLHSEGREKTRRSSLFPIKCSGLKVCVLPRQSERSASVWDTLDIFDAINLNANSPKDHFVYLYDEMTRREGAKLRATMPDWIIQNSER